MTSFLDLPAEMHLEIDPYLHATRALFALALTHSELRDAAL
jgi:hypothetical protein